MNFIAGKFRNFRYLENIFKLFLLETLGNPFELMPVLERKNEFAAKYKKVQSAERARNIFYVGRAALLLGGIAVHIWF